MRDKRAGERGEGTIREQPMKQWTQQGDPASFQSIVDQYWHDLYRVVYAILRHEEDTKDALQDIFIKIFYALPNYEQQGFKTWITRIAVNHAIDLVRKRRRMADKKLAYSRESSLEPSASSLDTPLLKKERQAMIRSRLQDIPSNYREVIKAYYLEEKSYKQIAEQLQLAEKTVEMRLYRARQWLRKHWKKEDFE